MQASLTRKEFFARMGAATAVLWLQACGGGGSSSYGGAPAPAPGGVSCSDTIAANHGHVLTVASADLNSATDMVYDIHGTADHTHSVTLTVANLQALKAGTPVMVLSSITGHQHSVAITCV